MSRRAPLPSMPATNTSLLPARVLANAILFPSGLTLGDIAWASPFSPVRFAVLRPSKMRAR